MKRKKNIKKYFGAAAVTGLLLCLAGCGAGAGAGAGGDEAAASRDGEDLSILVGVCPGPYGDMFEDAIKPGLEEKGYTVEIIEFSDYVQPNKALADGEIDVNLFQHKTYLDNFVKDYGLKLKAIAFVPTAGAGIYSNTIKSLKDTPQNTKVALANDVTNEARALRILQTAGLLTMDPEGDPSQYTETDIQDNPLNLEIVPVEAAQTPRAMDSAGLSVVNGNFAIGAGLDLNSALYTEVLEPDLKNVIAIRESDAGSRLEQDLLEVVQSDGFKSVIDDPEQIYHTFQKPDYQLYER